jgi:hypothetical protein
LARVGNLRHYEFFKWQPPARREGVYATPARLE